MKVKYNTDQDIYINNNLDRDLASSIENKVSNISSCDVITPHKSHNTNRGAVIKGIDKLGWNKIAHVSDSMLEFR